MSTRQEKLNIEELLTKLPTSDKVKLLAGDGWWHSVALPDAGVPAFRMSDGPNGVRGTQMFNGVPSSCFPSSTGLGASFDVDLAAEVGKALADECRAKGCHVLLGPTVNTMRNPLGGRGFESFSPDPYLNGTIAASYINGLQSKGVAATIKHYVANDQEFERFSSDSVVGERALREIYLKPFEIAVKKSNPWAFMTAYNRVNGVHASESTYVLDEILRKEWGWDGMVMSDWTGVYSTAASIKAGLDLEMPGPTVMRGAAALRSMVGRKLTVEDIDKCVRRILTMVNRAIDSGIPFNAPEKGVDTPELRQLLRRAATDSIVLLKNADSVLPLGSNSPKPKRIAVLGPNAKVAMASGGGSAKLLESWTVSPLQGISDAAKEIGAGVEYTIGAKGARLFPLLDAYLKEGKVLGEWWNEKPSDEFFGEKAGVKLPEAVWSTTARTTKNFCIDGVDETKVDQHCYIRWTMTFVPDVSGDWAFGCFLGGFGLIFLNGELIIDLYNGASIGSNFFGMATDEKSVTIPGLEAGKEYEVEIRMTSDIDAYRGGTLLAPRGGFRLGGNYLFDEDEEMERAVELAKDADATIVVIGLNEDWESEGFDRPDLTLPLRTNELVTRVLEVNPKAIIVNQTGSPVEMPWADQANTLVQAFYGGNELGNGLADVLFGKVNPSGKLSMTFPKRLEDSLAFPAFSTRSEGFNKVFYTEGIYIDYRGHDVKKIEPLFPFGHGLSYTSFSFSSLSASKPDDSANFDVSVNVKNTGSVAGREVVQVYIHDPVSELPRPLKELKGYAKTKVLQPGEEETVKIGLDRDALAFYSDKSLSWVAEAGVFHVLVGGEKVEIELGKTLRWNGL